MSNPVAKLSLEEFENRLCLSGPNGSVSLLSVLNMDPNAATKIYGNFVQGSQIANDYLRALHNHAGSTAFTSVVEDYQTLVMVVNSGALKTIDLNVAAAAKAYANGTGDAATLNAAIQRAALAFGYLQSLYKDYSGNAILAAGSISRLVGTNGISAVADNLKSLQNAIDYLQGSVTDTTVDQAASAFNTPLLPSLIDPTTLGGGTSGVFDPDNDGDDDTGGAGY